MIAKPIIKIYRNGELKILNELPEEEQDEIKEKLTDKIIELFSEFVIK